MGCDIHLKLERRKIGKTYMMRERFDDNGITEEVVELAPDKRSGVQNPAKSIM